MGQATRGGQSLAAFPRLHYLIEHEPWLAGAGVRACARCVGSVHTGYGGQGDGRQYQGYLIRRKREKATLPIVKRQDSPRPVYIRQYGTYA
jgi:hypothetical protein